jgi:hypothetical protein
MAKAPKSEIDQMRELGMSNEEIKAVLMNRSGINPPRIDNGDGTDSRIEPAPKNAHQRQDGNLGPDLEIVARHKALLANYVPPVLEVTYEVTLPRNRADYVERWAAYETAVRQAQAKKRNAPVPPPMTPAKAIEIIVGRYWQNDPDRALMAQGGSMSRAAFNETVAPLIEKQA